MRGHQRNPASVMVWWVVSNQGATDLRKGVQNHCKGHHKTVIEAVVNPLNTTLFQEKVEVFQQDTAPGHKVKPYKTGIRRNAPGFIAPKDWPSSRWDLIPRTGNCIRYQRGIPAQSFLKPNPSKGSNQNDSTDRWVQRSQRIKACAKARGGHFEWLLHLFIVCTCMNKYQLLKSTLVYRFYHESKKKKKRTELVACNGYIL